MALLGWPPVNPGTRRSVKISVYTTWIIFYPIICMVHEAYIIAAERQTGYIRTEPRPRPICSRFKRRRALSTAGRAKASDDTCRLLMLPREVRDMIWRELMEGMLIHFWTYRGKLAAGKSYELCFTSCRGDYKVHSTEIQKQSFGLMGCLMSCNQIYSEVIHLLYSLNVFQTTHPATIAYLPRMLLPQRINEIQFLNFRWTLKDPPSLPSPLRRPVDPVKLEKAKQKNHYFRRSWFRVWQNLAAMDSLIELKVELNITKARRHTTRTQSYLWDATDLEVVKTVTRPRKFQLMLAPELAARVLDKITAPNLEILGIEIAFPRR